MESETLSLAEGEALIAAALVASDVSPENAGHVARALVAAEADGHKGHGFSRVAAYAAQARSGKVDGHAVPEVSRPKPAFALVDAKTGFAFPALSLAVGELTGVARQLGIAAAAVRNSHHCGVLGHPVEALAETGLIGLMVANTPKAMAPWGGSAPLLGTNPIAFAAPETGAPPLVIDLSLSVVARGRIMAASKVGTPIPEDWALDADGNPTTDAAAALTGAMLPAAGAKGSALALMVEILAGAIAGPHLSFQASSFFDAEGPSPSVGQFLIAIDPLSGGQGVSGRVSSLLGAVAAEEGARLPGLRRLEARASAARDGVTVPSVILGEIRALAS